MSYVYPIASTQVSDSFADHVARGSVNPGTDYPCAHGTPVHAVAAGVVTDADGSPDGGGGRTIHVDHDDGSGADYLHLDGLSVSAGQRVEQGQLLGYSGGSGYGRNDYYGGHLHISFRPNHSHGYGNVGNLDFDALMRSQTSSAGGGSTPIEEDDEMTPDEKKQLADTRAMVLAMWQWMGGGTPTTQFYDIKKQLSAVQATTDNLAAGKGEVHRKLDLILFSLSDPVKGLREAVGALTALVKSIVGKLGG